MSSSNWMKHMQSPPPLPFTKNVFYYSQNTMVLKTHVVERQLRQSKQRFFEHGDKASRLLAQQARAASASRSIPRIICPSGNLTVDPVEINNIKNMTLL